MDEITKKPKRRKDLLVEELGDEAMLYDSQNEKIHVLNQTAYIIWKLCDGNHSITDIKGEIDNKFFQSEDPDFSEDIRKIIDEFDKKKLLIS